MKPKSTRPKPAGHIRIPKSPSVDSQIIQAAETSIAPLRIFISYASEDFAIATAVSNALTSCLRFANVFMDKSILGGADIPNELMTQLDQTNVLIVIFTGVERPSVSYPGYEVGYFAALERAETGKPNPPVRRTVPLYLNAPPSPIGQLKGYGFGITKDALRGTEEAFINLLKKQIRENYEIVEFIDQLIEMMTTMDGTDPKYAPLLNENSPDHVVTMMTAIFRHLKGTVEETHRPQKRMIIKTASNPIGEIPHDAIIDANESQEAIGIFGLSPVSLNCWKDFTNGIREHSYGSSWKDAIVTVVNSSVIPNNVVDNNQIIVSYDGGKIFRVILTDDTRYYDGRREFTLYFVETISPTESGDPVTTRLLNGLDIVCRFRFMFLEENSLFSSWVVAQGNSLIVHDRARLLVRELNLMMRDAQAAALDDVIAWAKMGISKELLIKMGQAWAPFDQSLRAQCNVILELVKSSNGEKILEAGRNLSIILAEMRDLIDPLNSLLIQQMTSRLAQLAGRDGIESDGIRPKSGAIH